MKYMLVENNDLNEFNKKINLLLDDGWILYGFSNMYKNENCIIYTQSLTKRKYKEMVIYVDSVEQMIASWNV